jgi:hypothetical protein
MAHKAWNEVREETIRNCFEKTEILPIASVSEFQQNKTNKQTKQNKTKQNKKNRNPVIDEIEMLFRKLSTSFEGYAQLGYEHPTEAISINEKNK